MDQYYTVLELQRDASIEEIKAAKNRLLQMWHPDFYQRNPELARLAEDKTKLINDAYDKLIKHLNTERQSPTRAQEPYPGRRSADYDYEPNTQKEDARRRAEHTRPPREEAEPEPGAKERIAAMRERVAKERAAERARVVKKEAQQEAVREKEARERIVIAGALCVLVLPIILVAGWKWLVSTDYAKDIYASWTDPNYYAPRLQENWIRREVPRHHSVVVKPIDFGAEIEIRLSGDDSTTVVVRDERVFFGGVALFGGATNIGFVEVRAANPQSVGRRYYISP